eukprot:TRINITY_DN3917_c0_g1_i1.p2 TRINITY_DN3917_c0_g1~~TRINITY_DN3917_c0_g1_i1.p2  ORF type:complete len:135 (+),score=47.92 TRINITY_DN3917_c0_g1_i1:80-484(+)
MILLYGLLVVVLIQLLLIAILLLPFPARLQKLISHLIHTQRRPLYFATVILLGIVAEATLEMSQAEQKWDSERGKGFATDEHLKLNKFRAERNFYLKAFSFTLMLIVLGTGHLSAVRHALEGEVVALEASKKTK